MWLVGLGAALGRPTGGARPVASVRTSVFIGTRVPVQSLFDYLEGGETLDEFLHGFPSVTREQAIAVLNLARATILAGARPS